MTSKFERDKVYKTRDGREFLIVYVDAAGVFPMIALQIDGRGEGDIHRFFANGKHATGNYAFDLMLPKPEPIVEWGYELPDRPMVMQVLCSEAKAREACAYGRPARLMKRTTEIVD